MATEKIQIGIELVGFKQFKAEVNEMIKLMKQLQREQKKAKVKVK